MLIYVIYFILIALLAVEYEFSRYKRWPVLVFLILILTMLAGFQGPNVSKDYENYQYIFRAVYQFENEIKNGRYFTFIEPGFLYVVLAFRSIFALNYSVAILLFLALVTITLKAIAINKLSVNPFLVILFYYSHYFFLQEMTQIRIAVASSIVFIAFIYHLEKKPLQFLFLLLLASLFHYSAMLYIIVLFINAEKLNIYLYCFILIVSIVMGIVKIPFFSLLDAYGISALPGKLEGYNYILKTSEGLKINTFNVIYLCNLFAALYLMLVVPKITLMSNKPLVFFLKCNIFSIFILSLFSGVPSLAFRLSELFGVTSAFMFAGLANYLPFRKLKMLFLVIMAFLFFYINIFYGDLIQPYTIFQFR